MLQQFEFPSDEKLLSVRAKTFPFYWHVKLEEEQIKHLSDSDEGMSHHKPSVMSIPLDTHTVLEGCIVISNTTVYECRPRISPERLFLEFCVTQSDPRPIEQLGLSLGLDLNFLFEKAVDFLLSNGDSKQATRIFHLSKGSPVARVASFAKHGYVNEILPYLQQLLRKEPSDIRPEERYHLVQLGLHGLVCRLIQEPQDEGLMENFRQVPRVRCTMYSVLKNIF